MIMNMKVYPEIVKNVIQSSVCKLANVRYYRTWLDQIGQFDSLYA